MCYNFGSVLPSLFNNYLQIRLFLFAENHLTTNMETKDIPTTRRLAPISDSKYQEINDFFFKDGKFQLQSAKDIKNINPADLAVWCLKKAIYGIPSLELINFLKTEIDSEKAIEIGAGNGYLGQFLDIPQTDSWLQAKPKIVAFYKMVKQPIIKYPSHIRKFDAVDAVKRFKPKVVIGQWVTQRSKQLKPQSSPYGINEKTILGYVDKYIMIGHETQHNQRLIRQYKHRVIKEDWICSRAAEHDQNVIYIWNTNQFTL